MTTCLRANLLLALTSDQINQFSVLCFMRSTNPQNFEVFCSLSLSLSVRACVRVCVASQRLGSRPGSLLYLLMLTPHSKPVDMHRNGHHNFGISHRFS